MTPRPIPQLDKCPSLLKPGHSTYSPAALRILSDGRAISPYLPYDNFTSPTEEGEKATKNRTRMSLSGAQPKYSMVLDKGIFRLAEEGEQGTYILKPKLDDFFYREYSPANENLTMQIASQVYGIETAANGLCFFSTGEAAYVTRRYDVASDGTKIQQEDFASLGRLNELTAGANYKYDALSYENIAELIRQFIPAWRVEIVRFFELMLFNFLFSNGDAHLKNFSVLRTPDGDYRLAPAYDLINTLIHIPTDRIFALQRGLFKDTNTDGMPITGSLFREFGKKIGIPQKIVERVLEKYCSEYDEIDTLIANSFLSDELKRMYRQMYRTRLVSYLRP